MMSTPKEIQPILVKQFNPLPQPYQVRSMYPPPPTYQPHNPMPAITFHKTLSPRIEELVDQIDGSPLSENHYLKFSKNF